MYNRFEVFLTLTRMVFCFSSTKFSCSSLIQVMKGLKNGSPSGEVMKVSECVGLLDCGDGRE